MGRRVILRPWSEEDLELLFLWRNSFHYREFCSMRKKSNSFGEFKEEFFRDLHRDRCEQFIICRNDSVPVGTIFIHDLSLLHENCFITTFIEEGKQSFGYGVEAFVLFCSHMTKQYGLNKIITDVYTHNVLVSKMLLRSGFVQEGYFKQHRKNREGGWIDIIRLSLFKKDMDVLHSFANQLKKIPSLD